MDLQISKVKNSYKIVILRNNLKKFSLNIKIAKILKMLSNLFTNAVLIRYNRTVKQNLMKIGVLLILKNGGFLY